MDKLIKLIKERIEIAKKRNFKTIHITITPDEAEELIKILEDIKNIILVKYQDKEELLKEIDLELTKIDKTENYTKNDFYYTLDYFRQQIINL